MNDKLVFNVIVLIIIALVVITILVINLVFKNQKSKSNLTSNTNSNQKDNDLTIEDLISIAADPNSSKEAIFKAVQYFTLNCKFPQKKDGIAPMEAKIYLRFVMLVSRHKNSDAKIISYLDNEIKKSNPNYGLEVDRSEENGINSRYFS